MKPRASSRAPLAVAVFLIASAAAAAAATFNGTTDVMASSHLGIEVVTLTAIPEISAAILGGIGFLLLCARRDR